ncbi:hypothetical protein Tco_0803981 [Tanacetum coccineum]|uniref:Uncharacterized protein n=1 Tax=Tanacetum coccineum TaxID=301880 RepID=A0ABQ5A7G1_9ASTR
MQNSKKGFIRDRKFKHDLSNEMCDIINEEKAYMKKGYPYLLVFGSNQNPWNSTGFAVKTYSKVTEEYKIISDGFYVFVVNGGDSRLKRQASRLPIAMHATILVLAASRSCKWKDSWILGSLLKDLME